MRWILLSVIVALCVVPLGVAQVQAEKSATCATKVTATQEKLDALLAQWKEAVHSTSLAQHEKLSKELTRLAQACPVGSEVRESLLLTRSALVSAVAADAECSKACASKQGEGAGCEKLAALMGARRQLLASLNEVAGYAAGLVSAGSACEKSKAVVAKGLCEKSAEKLALAVRAESCEKKAAALLVSELSTLSCKKKAGELVAQVKAAGCEKSAAKLLVAASVPAKSCEKSECAKACAAKVASADSKVCLKSLASQMKAVTGRLAGAATQYGTLSKAERQEVSAGLDLVMAQSEAARLVPATLVALSEGLSTLARVDQQLIDAYKKDPAVAGQVPEEAAKRFMAHAEILREASELLKHACATVQSARKGGDVPTTTVKAD